MASGKEGEGYFGGLRKIVPERPQFYISISREESHAKTKEKWRLGENWLGRVGMVQAFWMPSDENYLLKRILGSSGNKG